MQQILDLHIHSKYSRACSPQLDLGNIDKACRVKGVDIVATGDFTYPDWFLSIKNDLEEVNNSGLYKLKSAADNKIKFILSTELALIYKQGEGHARRLHIVVLAPSISAVEKFNKYLDNHGYNISSDGRPILGMSAIELCKILFDIDTKFLVFPAHIWTPWFAVFGSKSGFDSMEECFGEFTKYIYALETGLSSDPAMNWRLSALDKLTILSNSDAHSLPNIGREANVFEMKNINYEEIYDIIKNKKVYPIKSQSKIGAQSAFNGVKYTIEFYPEEGMYHYDGHRDCKVRLAPAETKKHKGVCPVCKKLLTVGVDYRVDELADRPVGFQPAEAVPFKKLVGLDKIIAEALDIKSRSAQKVQVAYNNLIKKSGSELNILINEPLTKLSEMTLPIIVEGIRRARVGELIVEPGFDGQYGIIKIFSADEKKDKQQKLF